MHSDFDRRTFLGASASTAALALAASKATAQGAEAAAPDKPTLRTTLVINRQAYGLALDPRVSLLDALSEHIGLSGTKKGCDHGQCGAFQRLAQRMQRARRSVRPNRATTLFHFVDQPVEQLGCDLQEAPLETFVAKQPCLFPARFRPGGKAEDERRERRGANFPRAGCVGHPAARFGGRVNELTPIGVLGLLKRLWQNLFAEDLPSRAFPSPRPTRCSSF
jgi:hypothetical protein